MLTKLLLPAAIAAPVQQTETTQFVDSLQYRTAAFANKQWIAHARTPALQMGSYDQRRALILQTPLASQPNLQRSVIDRPVKLDLSHIFEFGLAAAFPELTNYNRISLYFQSGSS